MGTSSSDPEKLPKASERQEHRGIKPGCEAALGRDRTQVGPVQGERVGIPANPDPVGAPGGQRHPHWEEGPLGGGGGRRTRAVV